MFCGMGGMSLGMKMAGIVPVAAVDIWSDAVDAYEKNFPKVKTYVDDLSSKQFRDAFVKEWKGRVYLVAGGPPCQTFSAARNQKYVPNEDEMSVHFASAATRIGPEIIIMENVPKYRRSNTWMQVQRVFQRNGYEVRSEVFDAVDFGIPQRRKRFIVVACKRGSKCKDLSMIPKVRVQKSIGEILGEPTGKKVNDKEKNTIISRIGMDTKQREKHRKWRNSYYVLDETKPAPTIHGAANKSHSYGSREYKGDYFDISPDEAKVLQSFPKSFKLHPSEAKATKMIGNAIPPLLVKKIIGFYGTRDNA